MHELSIALSILEIAEEEAERLGTPVVAAVHLRLGPLSGVVPRALQSAFELAREGTSLEASQLVIEETPLTIFCPTCEAERLVESLQELRCAVCGTAGNDVRSGRELEIRGLEIET